MFSDFFNNKTTIVTIFIAILLILFFVFSFAIVLIQEKIEDTVYTTKERLRKSAVLLIGSTVNTAIAWFIYSWMIKPRLDSMVEKGSSFDDNEDVQTIKQNLAHEYVSNVEQDPTYENVPTIKQDLAHEYVPNIEPIPSDENSDINDKFSDRPAFINEDTN